METSFVFPNPVPPYRPQRQRMSREALSKDRPARLASRETGESHPERLTGSWEILPPERKKTSSRGSMRGSPPNVPSEDYWEIPGPERKKTSSRGSVRGSPPNVPSEDYWEIPGPERKKTSSRRRSRTPTRGSRSRDNWDFPQPARKATQSREMTHTPKRDTSTGDSWVIPMPGKELAHLEGIPEMYSRSGPDSWDLFFDVGANLPSNIKVGDVLGSGSYGIVYSGVSDDGKEKAYKVFGRVDLSDIEKISDLNFAREASIYKYLGNRNPRVCYVDEIGAGYISMCLAKGDLREEMVRIPSKKRSSMQYKPRLLSSCIDDMASLLAAVDILHRESVGHFDIKPENILRTKGGKVKLCDLGSASIIPDTQMEKFIELRHSFMAGDDVSLDKISNITTAMTQDYAAPESFVRNKDYLIPLYPAADIWSLGMIFFEMLTGYNLYISILRRSRSGGVLVRDGDSIRTATGLMSRFTQDMMRESFAVYDKNWKSIFSMLPRDKISNVSPLELLMQEQRTESFIFDEKEEKNLTLAWSLIKRMLDPNPLTRITAAECLRSPIFVQNIHVSNVLKDFYAAYDSRSTNNTRTPTNSKLYKSVDHRLYLRALTKEYDFLGNDGTLAARTERIFNLALQNVGSITEAQIQIVMFCATILAFYAEYRSRLSSTPLSNLHNMMKDASLGDVRKKFFGAYTGSDYSLKNAVYTALYFLLVEILEFDLWS